MADIIVYKSGIYVQIKNINVNGYITGIIIRDDRILYEVSYFLNDNYCSHCFYEYQLCFVQPEKITIGFK
jgi:hypothetical protein